MPKRPIAVDLFAGVGGMSLGFEQAGFDIKAAVEIDPVHAACHAYNFPDCTVLPRSITELSGSDIAKKAGIEGLTVDVVCGGAPCQGFSLIGKRALDDPRNALVREFVRIVRELDARSFVFENVKGLTLGKHKDFLLELIETFKVAGYDVVEKTKVLNAANYGVPQNRERLFLLGVKRGERLPTYPNSTTTFVQGINNSFLPRVPSVADALYDLPDAESFSSLENQDWVATKRYGKPSDYVSVLRCLSNDAWAFGHPRIWSQTILTSSMRTNHTAISRRRFKETQCGKVEPISRLFKLDPDGISNTLRAGTDASRGAFTSPRPIHPKHDRCVTVREMGRLHGFPDWFRFHQTKWHGARQIGNSVPPPLAKAVAGQIMTALGITPERSEKNQTLGDEKLLVMDLSSASKYWNVQNPIGRRDRKSGDKKRSQVRIEEELQRGIAAE